MPCDSITTVTLKLEKADMSLLKAALEKLHLNPFQRDPETIAFYTGSYNSKTGSLTAADSLITQIKQEYSAQLVENISNQFGWTVNKTDEYEYVAEKQF